MRYEATAASGLVLMLALRAVAAPAVDAYAGAMTAATDAVRAGRFADAEKLYERAETGARSPGDAWDARLGEAQALGQAGEVDRAVRLLFALQDEAVRAHDDRRTMRADLAIGGRTIRSQSGDAAERYLRQGLDLAARLNDRPSEAAGRNDLANLLAGQGKTDAALEQYRQSATAADAAGDATAAADARVNAALAATQAGKSADTADAARHVDALPPSDHKAALLLALATAQRTPGDPAGLRSAFASATTARDMAATLGDPSMQSGAWTSCGELYLAAGQFADATTAARRAGFYAQQARSPDAAWRAEWLLGRSLAARGQSDDAIAAYRRALGALKPIRHDLAIDLGSGNTPTSFRKNVGPVYFELADLLLRRADADAATGRTADEQADLRSATDTVEQFKSAELQDYFRDDCTSLAKSREASIDQSLASAAVVYVVPLKDRTEIIVSTAAGRRRYRAEVGSDELARTARSMRQLLEYDMDYSYRQPAAKLYDWLIRPMKADLQAQGIDTLVIVPDGELRTIPLGALYDKPAKKHLIEDFAVAVSPGLTLIDDQGPATRGKLAVLAAGETQAVQDFPALPNVKQEMASIESNFQDARVLMDAGFQKSAFSQSVSDTPFSIVHVASHGEFAGDAAKTFVLTHDSRLSLNELQELLLPSQFRDKPIELLTLSACQTAAGADGARAALGLGGVAVKSGARAALATLWAVDDYATSVVITNFYAALKDRPDLNKAQCLRLAQLSLLHNAGGTLPYGCRHPRKWAPYLIIGNWK